MLNLIVSIVELQESVGIAKALAAKNGYDLDSNQEVYFKSIGYVLPTEYPSIDNVKWDLSLNCKTK